MANNQNDTALKDKVIVITGASSGFGKGAAGKVMTFSHNLAPGMTEAQMGKLSHREQMEKAAPAADTPGSVQQPSQQGTEVSGGRLESQER